MAATRQFPGVLAADEERMEVLKFGGSSLVSAEAMQRVRDVLVARRGTQRIVVCSAMGGVTNALIQIGLKAAQGDAGYEGRAGACLCSD